MSILNLDNLSNEELKKRLASQVNLDDWADDCGKCGYPRLLHKELHRASACTQEQEVPNILNKNWTKNRKRIKPLLRELKEASHKDAEQGVLLEELEKLITESRKLDTENTTTLVTSIRNSFKKETLAVAAVTHATETGTRVPN